MLSKTTKTKLLLTAIRAFHITQKYLQARRLCHNVDTICRIKCKCKIYECFDRIYSSIVGTLTKTQVRYGFENTDILNISGQFFHCVLFEETQLSLFRYFHHEFPVIRSKAFNW
jgi:hypothetical protein